MRVADIIAEQVEPGTVVADATAPEAKLSPYARLAPSLGAEQVHASTWQPKVPPRTLVVLQHLPLAEVEQTAWQKPCWDQDLGAEKLVGILFAERPEDVVAKGVLEELTRSGWVLDAAHAVEHPRFRVALVAGPADAEQPRSVLRVVNEYRFERLVSRMVEARRLAAVQAEDRLRRSVHKLEQELAAARAENQQLSAGLERARRTAADLQSRAEAADRNLEATFKRLERTRKAVSFRLGRATAIAAREARKSPIKAPARWLKAFRGPDDILADLAVKKRSGASAAVGADELSDRERRELERRHYLLGHGFAPGVSPGVAGVVGRRLGAELEASTRYAALTPNAWRYQLEVDRPAYVLVTSDAFERTEAWGGYGVPGGKGLLDELAALVDWCREQGLPVVYWDTLGKPRPRVGAPRGIGFDAAFTVSPGLSGQDVAGLRAQLLLPAIEPRFYNPIGVPALPPRRAVLLHAVDRAWGGDRDLVLQAAKLAQPLGSCILDDSLADPSTPVSLDVGAELVVRAQPRASASSEAKLLRDAGALVCDSPGDFPGWEALRALAVGANVVLVGGQVSGDEAIRGSFHLASDASAVAGALEEALQRSRLDDRWAGGFSRVLQAYSLADRLRAIDAVCGGRGAVPEAPSLAVVARASTDSERTAFAAFLEAQTSPPREVCRFDDGSFGPVLDKLESSHVFIWDASAPSAAELTAELQALLHLSDADVIGLGSAAGAADGAVPVYRRGGGELSGHVLALRRELAAAKLEEVSLADPARAARELLGAGATALFKQHSLAEAIHDSRSAVS